MLSINIENFTFFSICMPFIYFSFLVALARISTIILNKNGKRGHPYNLFFWFLYQGNNGLIVWIARNSFSSTFGKSFYTIGFISLLNVRIYHESAWAWSFLCRIFENYKFILSNRYRTIQLIYLYLSGFW